MSNSWLGLVAVAGGARDSPGMRQLPRGTVTLLFTDVEGSTRLLQELGPSRYVPALGAHRRCCGRRSRPTVESRWRFRASATT
jgi:class 3 adenylate cyclase